MLVNNKTVYQKGTIVYNNITCNNYMVTGEMRNHNGLHIKVVKLSDGFVGSLNDIESDSMARCLTVSFNCLDEYLSKNNIEDWILYKIECLMELPYIKQ